jgi:hypothetical protein
VVCPAVLSIRVCREIDGHLKSQPAVDLDMPLIFSQRNRRTFWNVTLSMLLKEIYELAAILHVVHSGRRTFGSDYMPKSLECGLPFNWS